jgi:predicted metal-dependent HD superfamily phosphohydrolase
MARMELPQHRPLADIAREHWPLPSAESLRDELLAAYADPSRRYHDVRHLTEVLSRLAQLTDAGVRFDQTAVGLAAWFHDAVYDGERDAEERSAAWAEDALPGLVDEPVVAEVARLVRMTEQHSPEDDDADACALSDADLGILAADAARYDEYVTAVRHEYGHLTDAEFAAGRAQVLESLLAKDDLFHTTFARAHWEAPARANMERELASWR